MKMKKNVKEEKMCSRTRIHNVRFYNLSPRAINCMDYNKEFQKLALARNDGSIEIWDMEHTVCLEKMTPKLKADTSIESIVWAGKRLFTAGLNGEVVEWNTTSMTPRWQQRVTGNAIWCLAVNKQCTELAIGTEEGYINVFNIENDEFQYKLLYDKQEGRVLCCSFDVTGNHLVTGSVKAVRVWNARTGHALQKMTLPKTVENKDTIIWTLKVLEDFSIVAGDSRGYITVYDGNTGNHLEAHQVLKADVLALNVNETGDMLVCSGVEPIIRIYAKTQIKREDATFYRWVKYLQRAVHDHDVKSLICASGDRILSGGVDGFLGVSFITRMRSTISRQGPFLQHPCATVASEAKLLLLRYPMYLEIWRLGAANTAIVVPHQTTETNEENDKPITEVRGKSYALETSPIKLLELRSKNDDPISCATLSTNGKWLSYSTIKEVRLFNFIPAESDSKTPSQMIRIKNKSLQGLQISHMCFSNDSQSLFLVSRANKQLLIFDLPKQDQENDVILLETIDLSSHIKGCITHLTLSSSGKFLAIADDDHTIAVWCLGKSKKYEHRLNLPRYEAAVTTAIAIQSHKPCIVVAFSDSRIVEYDIEKACFTCWYDQAYVVPNTETHCVTQILLDERNPDIIIFQNDGYLYTMEKYTQQNDDDQQDPSDDESNEAYTSIKKAKISFPNTKSRHMLSLRLKYKKPYEHLVHTSWLSNEDLITISVNRNLLIEQLPPAFRQKKYGTT